MKSTEYVLITNVLDDVGTMCNTSMDRDRQEIRSRLKHEGLSFLTITLPTFAKAFERGLEQGWIDPTLFPAFSKWSQHKRGGQIPEFLHGIVVKVFQPWDGVLRDDASPDAIDAVRQICLLFNKYTKECSNARKRKAIEAFLQCEEDLGQVRLHTWQHRDNFRSVARTVFGGVFNDIQEILYAQRLVPKHGPGAVVENFRGNAKYRSRSWSKRLDRAMSADNHLFSNSETWLSGRESLEFLSKSEESPVKVMFVPKTAKTPRVIAIEPIYMQYAQQALLAEFVARIEKDPLLGKSIHFTDASINGNLARKASVDRLHATLDMSEASDRVHAALVADMFGSYPDLRNAIFACRSSKAKLPDGQVLTLKKFASMGSALCFPVESMVFYTLCVLAGLLVRGKPATPPQDETCWSFIGRKTPGRPPG
jgi:hypothetical protein